MHYPPARTTAGSLQAPPVEQAACPALLQQEVWALAGRQVWARRARLQRVG